MDGAESKTTWTYFIQSGFDGPIKIGRSDNPEGRLVELQVGSHETLRLLLVLEGDVEFEMHTVFRNLHIRGEWFTAGETLLQFIAENSGDRGSLERIVATARFICRTYERMEQQVSELWFQLAVNESISPHFKAFCDAMDRLKTDISSSGFRNPRGII